MGFFQCSRNIGFFCKQNNDRDMLLEMNHRDTLVFLKWASFVNKIMIEKCKNKNVNNF